MVEDGGVGMDGLCAGDVVGGLGVRNTSESESDSDCVVVEEEEESECILGAV